MAAPAFVAPVAGAPSLRSSTFVCRSAPAASRPASAARRNVVRMEAELGEDGYEKPVVRRLSDALKERDVEARKEREAGEARARAKEAKRNALQRKIDQLNAIPDDKPVGTIAEYMYGSGVKETLEALDHDLVGLKPIKARCAEIASLLILDKLRTKLGLETSVPSLHMCFTGSPGTGKTTVAMRIGEILKKMGYSRTGNLVVATRDDLVGQYVGHTGPKTKNVIKTAFGGVLLVDEAYYLYNASNDRDYGQESIEIIQNVMETQADDLTVIFAGYEDKMDRFFSFLPGLSSRVQHHLEFPDYSGPELVEIAEVMIRDLEYELAAGSDDVFQKYIEKRMEMPYFSNARTVRNAVDRARMRASIRLFNTAMGNSDDDKKVVSRKDLQLIMPQDIVSVEELMARGEGAIVE